MTVTITLNADVGEGWGLHRIGDDEALIPLMDAVNIACGAHGGDHHTMRHCVQIASAHGVAIGAHPGFADLDGFGRRRIELPADEIESLVAVQIGALQAVAALEGARLTHVKPHGALYNMAAERREVAEPIARAVAMVDRELVLVGQAGTPLIDAGIANGLHVAGEGFVDRAYTPAGLLVARSEPGAVFHDPEFAAARAVALAAGDPIATHGGTELRLAVDTLCIHGDEPTAVVVARAVAAALVAAGIVRAAFDRSRPGG